MLRALNGDLSPAQSAKLRSVDFIKNNQFKFMTKTYIPVFQFAAVMIITLVAIDMFGFLCWASSGQRPVDNFYVGTITTHALQAVIK